MITLMREMVSKGSGLRAMARKALPVVVPAVLLLFLMAAPPAKAQLGVSAGYGINNMSQPSFEGQSNSLESTGGFKFGLFYNFPIGQVDVRPGMFIQQNSFEWHLDGVEVFSPIESEFRVAGVPVDFRYRFSENGFVPFVLLGPEFNFVHTNRPELREVLDDPSGTTYFTSINVGAGIQWELPSVGLALHPQVRYSQALSGFVQEDYIVRSVEYNGDSQLSMSNLLLRVDISFLQ